VERVINACDAGREGEHIFRLVYEHAKCKKPLKRLWISSMEEAAIKTGFDNLKDGAEYQLKRVTRNLHCGCQNTTAVKLKSGQIADITNQKFGRLTALRPTDKRIDRAVIWECECSCGKKGIYRALDSLRDSGERQSCGCWLSEISRENNEIVFNYIDGTRIESIKDQKLLKNNKSGIRGVNWDKNANKWRAIIYFQGRQIHLGLFADIDDAARARKVAEDEYYKPVIEKFEVSEKAEAAPKKSRKAVIKPFTSKPKTRASAG